MKIYLLKQIKIFVAYLFVVNVPAYAMVVTQKPKSMVESSLDIQSIVESLAQDETSYLSLIKDVTTLERVPWYQLGTECQQLINYFHKRNVSTSSVTLKTTNPSLKELEIYFSALIDIGIQEEGSEIKFLIDITRQDFCFFRAIQMLAKKTNINNIGGLYNRTPLEWASVIGNEKTVHELIKAGAALNRVNEYGCTPLYTAVMHKQANVIPVLIAGGALPDIHLNNDGNTPMHWAAKHGYIHGLRELIRAGADINRANGSGKTPLYKATSGLGYRYKTMQELIRAGANLNRAANSGKTPLYKALTKLKDTNAVQKFIEADADIDQTLWYANQINDQKENRIHDQKVIEQLQKFSPVNLITLLSRESQSYFSVLPKDIITMLKLPLKQLGYLAQEYDQLNNYLTQKLKLKNNIGPESSVILATNNSWEKLENAFYALVVMDLCRAGSKGPFLRDVAEQDAFFLQVIQTLIKKGVDINAEGQNGWTALGLASLAGNTDVVQKLIKNGADVNYENNPPLHIAAFHGNAVIVEILVEAGADPNKMSREGTPLHQVAMLGGKKDMIRLLLKLNAQINKSNVVGKSPLYIAAEMKNNAIILELIKSGANIDQALQRARESNDESVIQFLSDKKNDFLTSSCNSNLRTF